MMGGFSNCNVEIESGFNSETGFPSFLMAINGIDVSEFLRFYGAQIELHPNRQPMMNLMVSASARIKLDAKMSITVVPDPAPVCTECGKIMETTEGMTRVYSTQFEQVGALCAECAVTEFGDGIKFVPGQPVIKIENGS